ncbi:MAG: hypothetical protein N3F66_00785 [Spirochaetes bacterium]|nr:hypothetical protein [Spirochaetota bacterium]
MKRIVTVMVLMLNFVFFAFRLSATTTRDMGLGLFEYPWFIDGLQSYIYENPAYISNYGDKIYAERIGIINGENKGGVIYNIKNNLFIGVDLGSPVDTSLWNTNAVDSLFNVDVYSAKCKSHYNHSIITSQSMKAYQVELLDETILDIKDPYDASELVGTNTTSPQLREKLNQRNFSALFGYKLNKFSVGFYAGYATSWKHYRDSTSATNSHEEYNLINAEYSAKLGVSYIINNKVSFDISGFFFMYALDNNYMQRKPGIDFDMSYKSDGAMDFGSNLRVNYAMTNNQKVHFYVSYWMLNRSTKGEMLISDSKPINNVNATDTFERKGQKISAGVSDEISIDKNMIVFIGFLTNIEFFKNNYYGVDAITPANNVDTYTLNYKAIEVPVIIGLEANVSENWKGRLGLVQKIYKPLSYDGTNIINQGANKIPTTIDEISSSSSTLYTGLSYKLNNFTFDWLMNVELFTVGPYIISGKSWTANNENPLAFAFAITYNFETKSSE